MHIYIYIVIYIRMYTYTYIHFGISKRLCVCLPLCLYLSPSLSLSLCPCLCLCLCLCARACLYLPVCVYIFVKPQVVLNSIFLFALGLPLLLVDLCPDLYPSVSKHKIQNRMNTPLPREMVSPLLSGGWHAGLCCRAV